ncbi:MULTISPECIES: sensor domain-containing diguanylate cyclase [unclassified Aliivibrio]|uniref:sensor domain-containing diguanylate cyclase n=1 Tax=unclassified Aliivibrio TaxID=2645654 RepID=UPI00080EE4D0|nr:MULTISPECIES: sensor domain-containing diguanylate cyclase [unclassified Aliivibrio]OCH15243.1 diguanylate cyclase [Aliivibrio sp. 1S128]OCH16547.1 diguanylate cyclase [Aliivibrio sp. 1S165]OCH33365.1 diguanylate cyclase [Aliivibrio sp. 1S175]
MKKNTISKKWLYLPIISTILTITLGLFVFNSTLSNWLEHKVEGSLSEEITRLIKDINDDNISFTDLKSLDVYIKTKLVIAKEDHITLITSDGTPIADSDISLSSVLQLENHLNRQEIVNAQNFGYGTSTRFSTSRFKNLLYSAKSFEYQGSTYILRAATPLTRIDAMVEELMNILIILMSINIVLVIASSLLSNKLIQQQVQNEQDLQEERIEQRTQEIELLHRLATMLAACNSINEAQMVVEDILPRILGDVNGVVSLMRSSRNQLLVKLDWGGAWPGSKTYAPEECWALRKGKFHFANDKYTTLPCSHMSATGIDQTLCIPLTAHGNTIGMMHIYLGNTDNLDDNVKKLAFTVAEHLGLALANLNLQEKLREQAISDPLTGLYNRRYYEETINQEIMRAQRHKQEMSILMLDLDHFKRFNDNYGHDAGDYVLKTIGSLLLNIMRGEDTVCRLGGEELAIILPNTGAEGALHVANELCKSVSDLHLAIKDLSLGKLSVSIGIATYPKNGLQSEDITKLADIALYEAKGRGRDQACHYDELIQSPDVAEITEDTLIINT